MPGTLFPFSCQNRRLIKRLLFMDFCTNLSLYRLSPSAKLNHQILRTYKGTDRVTQAQTSASHKVQVTSEYFYRRWERWFSLKIRLKNTSVLSYLTQLSNLIRRINLETTMRSHQIVSIKRVLKALLKAILEVV